MNQLESVFMLYCIIVIADCMTLESPQNGAVQFNSTLQGSTATYTCITGYTLDGAGLRTCLSTGLWSDSNPTCECKSASTHACFFVMLKNPD